MQVLLRQKLMAARVPTHVLLRGMQAQYKHLVMPLLTLISFKCVAKNAPIYTLLKINLVVHSLITAKSSHYLNLICKHYPRNVKAEINDPSLRTPAW